MGFSEINPHSLHLTTFIEGISGALYELNCIIII